MNAEKTATDLEALAQKLAADHGKTPEEARRAIRLALAELALAAGANPDSVRAYLNRYGR